MRTTLNFDEFTRFVASPPEPPLESWRPAFLRVRVERPQPSREDYPTALAFFQALSEWIGGWENLSERTRNSLVRIGEELCGYPQLASEARYAAGQIGHVARRLLLGNKVPPYCDNLDLDDFIPSTRLPFEVEG